MDLQRSNSSLLPMCDDIPRVKEVIVEDKAFAIHSYRFAAKSDFFFALLFHDFSEKKQRKIKIYGITKEIFEEIHTLFNTGVIKPTVHNAIQIYIACRYLLVKDAYIRDLQRFIINNLDQYDLFDLYEYCLVNNDPLLDHVTAELAPEMESYYRDEPFRMLHVGAMLNLVTDSRVRISQEDSICWAVAFWLAHSWERRSHLGEILQRLAPIKFGPNVEIELTKDEWNSQVLADHFYYFIFEYEPRIQRPFKSEFFKPDEPLYLSNEDGLLVAHHCEGTQWSMLYTPRMPIHPSITISAAARKQADLYVATSQPRPSFKLETNILHYNFRSRKMTGINTPTGDDIIKALHFINGKLYSNTKTVLRQYCAEHNLWLDPIDIGLSDYHFSASDNECFYVCGHYEWSGKHSIHFYDPRSPEWIYYADVPRNNLGTCGTFIGDDLYMVALGQTIREWNVLKFDVRNCQWQLLTTYWSRNSATPISIRQCRDKLVVMDHYRDTFMATNEVNGEFQLHDHYKYALKPVCSID